MIHIFSIAQGSMNKQMVLLLQSSQRVQQDGVHSGDLQMLLSTDDYYTDVIIHFSGSFVLHL